MSSTSATVAAPIPRAGLAGNWPWIGTIVLLVAATAAAFVFSDYHLFQLTMVVVYALAILGLAIVTGFNGQISLGHGAFYAIGAYVTAILMSEYDVPYWATLPVAAIVCAVFGFLIGLPALRLGGLYLALTTFALAVAMPQILKHKALEAWTGGVQGLVIDKPDAPFGLPIDSDQWLYLFTLGVGTVVYLLVWNLLRGRIGRGMRAIRDQPTAAEAMGIDLAMFKTRTFAVSAMVTGRRRIPRRHCHPVRCPRQLRRVRVHHPVRRPGGRRRRVHRRHRLRRHLHRVRSQPRRPGVQGRARGDLWRHPDRRDVPDAGRGGRFPRWYRAPIVTPYGVTGRPRPRHICRCPPGSTNKEDVLMTIRISRLAAALVAVFAMSGSMARAQTPGVTATELKIGQTMPYSGPGLAVRRHRQAAGRVFQDGERVGRHRRASDQFHLDR